MSEAIRTTRSSDDDLALALSFAAAIRTASYFDTGNAVAREAAAGLAAHVTGRAERDGGVQIGVHSHCVFVGAARIRASLATFDRFATLDQTFADREINSVTFHAGVSEAELAQLVAVLAKEPARGPDVLTAILRGRGVTHVDVELLSAGTGIRAVAPVETFAAAIELGEKLREATLGSRLVDVRHARHVTQAVVDQILDDPHALLALTTIKELDEGLVSHSANVAILSVLLGQRLGLSKYRLGELCLAGFLHDAGKLEVAAEVLGKPGPLDPDEWEELRKHPVVAARSLVSGRKLTPAIMRAVVVAYEHHLNYDMSGYPASAFRDHVSLYGNIVAIADRYDALTTARPYRRFSFSPHEIIGYLTYYAGTSFDPLLVKLFVDLIGIYPPGTMLRLTNGDLCVVCAPPAPGRALDRPKVRVWTGTRRDEVVDLGDPEQGASLDIAMVLSPAGMGQAPAIAPANARTSSSRY